MSNDKSTADDISLDLEDSDANDSSADEAERSDDSIDESEDEVGTDLDLEPEKEEDKAAKREAAVKQHAKAYAAKIILGKATYDDIPSNHKYLVPHIKALLGQKEESKDEKQKSSKTTYDVSTLVKFETLKAKVQQAPRTIQQNKILNSEFNLLLSKGFEPDVALKRAIKEAEVDLSEPAAMPKIKVGGSPKVIKQKFTGNEDPNKMSREELADYIANRPR